jgi:hypothetical protein
VDFQAKLEMIEGIEDEVNELHPLLNTVLERLDTVKRVEYTHGPSEKGADFVLLKEEPALSNITHVGVIAKIGKIQQDFSELERQIDECGLPRKILGGKQEVRLSEIWVITTSTISANAKDKIFDKYGKQKIEFIDGCLLTRLVDRHANYFWDHIPSPAGSYLSSVEKRISQLDHELSVIDGLDCEDFYIEPDIQEIEQNRYVLRGRRRTARYIQLIEEVKVTNVSVLEAEMGFGKSKIVRMLANTLCSPQRFKRDPYLPILLTYRTFEDRYRSDIDACIKGELKQLVDGVGLEKAKIILILDGFDEAIPILTNATEALTRLIDEAKKIPYLSVLLTTRPLPQLNKPIDLLTGVRRFVVRPLSMQKLVQFIEKACAKFNLPKRLYEDLRRSDLFKQLPQSPIAAALLSSLLSQNQYDLPSSLTELYSKAIEAMLGRWDVQKKIATEKEYQAADKAAMLLAEYMIGNRLIWLSESEAKQHVKEWLDKRNLGIEINQVFARLVEKSGIFARDADTNTIFFRHRSFGEYLYAKNALRNSSLSMTRDAFNPYWIYIYFFYLGLKEDCPTLLHELMSIHPSSEIEAWLKVLIMPDYLLAAYQSEYKIVEENLFKLFIHAAELYRSIRRGDTETKLVELPEMTLLWFFQRVIRHSYEYEYFKKAIDATILRIDSEMLEPEVKYLALFFASCFAAELNDSSGFEYLVKHYGADKLPLSISLAIKLEQQTNKDFAKLPLLKAHERRLAGLLSVGTYAKKDSDKRAREQLAKDKMVKDLFEEPLKTRLKHMKTKERSERRGGGRTS